MYKILLGLIAASVFILSACGGDDGELAGKWKGDKGDEWIITYNKKDNEYSQKIFMLFSNGAKDEVANNTHLKRDGDWVAGQKEKYFIKVIDRNSLQFRDDVKDIYRRIE